MPIVQNTFPVEVPGLARNSTLFTRRILEAHMQKLRSLVAALVLAGAATVFVASPLLACHEPTGWCCIEGLGCCYWENDEIVECFLFHE